MTTETLTSLAHAVGDIGDGAHLALGGGPDDGRPLALVRELVRQGRRKLHLTGWATGADVELLVRVDAAEQVSIPGYLGPRGTQIGDDAGFYRFVATAQGLDYFPLKAAQAGAQEAASPTTGAPHWVVPAARPDVAVLHASAATPNGTVLSNTDRRTFERDRAIVAASGAVVVSVEQIVSDDTAAHAEQVLVQQAHAVVLAPFGSHPAGFAPNYQADEVALARLAAVADPAQLESEVRRSSDHWSYLDSDAGIGALLHRAGDRRRRS